MSSCKSSYCFIVCLFTADRKTAWKPAEQSEGPKTHCDVCPPQTNHLREGQEKCPGLGRVGQVRQELSPHIIQPVHHSS